MMFLGLKLKRIVGFARGSRAVDADAMDFSRVRTRSLAIWALIALVPSSLVGGIAAYQLRPRSQFAVGLAAGAEVSAFIRASALEPEPEVTSPDRSATASAAPTRQVESHDPRPTVEEARPTVLKPDVTPEPVLIVTRAGPAEEIALGRALFDRRWRPGDPRCHNGDGLGRSSMRRRAWTAIERVAPGAVDPFAPTYNSSRSSERPSPSQEFPVGFSPTTARGLWCGGSLADASAAPLKPSL
jgi:hypothetical protein